MPNLHSITFATDGWQLSQESAEARLWQGAGGDLLEISFLVKQPILDWPLARIDEIRKDYRGIVAPENGAIVEIEAEDLQGIPALRTILKFAQDPHGMSYMGSWIIPRSGFSFVISATCAELGTTGVRDSTVALKLRFARPEGDPLEGWFEDPYDPEFRSPVLRNRSDDPSWDHLFPQHPLTRLRNCLHRVQETISIDDDVRMSEPFLGP